MKRTTLLLVSLMAMTGLGSAQMVMNENTGDLPPRCGEIAGWENITVHGGTQYAEQFPGTIFTYDQRVFQFEPCTKLSVTFVNHDAVRHQWMVHGLPPAIYDMGMFTLEAPGTGNVTGTFILPGRDETLLTHCGVPQHQEKGMKGQITVGAGDGNLGGIPGHTGHPDAYDYPRESPWREGGFFALIGLLVGGAIMMGWRHGDFSFGQDTEETESS